MKRFFRKITTAALTAFIFIPAILFPGCDKSEDGSTVGAVSPVVQTASGGEFESCTADASVFVHYGIDTLEWKVMSYEDAVVGKVTNALTGETRLPEETGRLDMNGNLAFGPVNKGKIVLVAHNRRTYEEFSKEDLIIDARMYAYRNFMTENGLPELRVSVAFQPWQTQNSMLYLKWTMKNDNTTWALNNTWDLIPLVQMEEGKDPEVGISAEGESDISVYVHYGLNLNQWTVENYDDSREGIITYIGQEGLHKQGDKRHPDIQAKINSADRVFQLRQLKDTYAPSIPLSMVLVAHNSNSYSDLSTAGVSIDSKMYAFRDLEWGDVSTGDTLEISVRFDPRRRESKYTDSKYEWTMMNDNVPRDIP